jgi:hypothetical protein
MKPAALDNPVDVGNCVLTGHQRSSKDSPEKDAD